MVQNFKHIAVNVLFVMLYCDVIHCLAKDTSNNLLSLLDATSATSPQPSVAKKNVEKTVKKSSANLSLLSQSLVPTKTAKKSVKKGEPDLELLLQQHQAVNPDYQAAVKILLDPKIQQQYRDALEQIQFGFLQYSTNVLHAYSVQAQREAAKNNNLLHLLQEFQQTSAPQKAAPVAQAPSLVDLLKSEPEQAPTATDPVVQQHANLSKLLQSCAPIVVKKEVVQKAEQPSLLTLLHDQSPAIQPSVEEPKIQESKVQGASPDKNNLLQLLSSAG